MILAFKENNKVYVIHTRQRNPYLIKDYVDDTLIDNILIHKYPNDSMLTQTSNPRIADLIKDCIEYDTTFNYDLFYYSSYKPLKERLKEYLILDPSHVNPSNYDGYTMIFAKDNQFILIKDFKHLEWGGSFYASEFHMKLHASFEYHKKLPIEKRIIYMFLDLMDHVSTNYFPLHISDTKSSSIKIITLKEALCQYDS
jgi:hypothetical protein